MISRLDDVQTLRSQLDKGHSLGMPDGVLINGKGPYPYNSTLVPKGILWETFNVLQGGIDAWSLV